MILRRRRKWFSFLREGGRIFISDGDFDLVLDEETGKVKMVIDHLHLTE